MHKYFITAFGLLVLFSTTASADLSTCAAGRQYRPTYCDVETAPQKKQAPQATNPPGTTPAPMKRFRAPPPPKVVPPPRLREDHRPPHPIMIIPSFLGMILADTSDVVADGVFR
jgi:hypothetical protein